MSFIEINGKRHPIPPGESAIGSDSNGFIALQGESITSRHLLIQGTADGQAAVRRADDSAETHINGVRLGPQPTPLLHGDKIELGGYELLFVDERRSGSTQFVSAEELAKYQPLGAKRPQGAGGASNGRLVSLTDGREYTIVGSPLVLGREAGCDVVVTSKRVSRRHAEIVATAQGYLLRDTSTNGTFVNGERIDGERVLRRADVVRVGDDEFRFYVDAVAEAPEGSDPEDLTGAPAADEAPQAEAIQGVPSSVSPDPVEAAPPPPPANRCRVQAGQHHARDSHHSSSPSDPSFERGGATDAAGVAPDWGRVQAGQHHARDSKYTAAGHRWCLAWGRVQAGQYHARDSRSRSWHACPAATGPGASRGSQRRFQRAAVRDSCAGRECRPGQLQRRGVDRRHCFYNSRQASTARGHLDAGRPRLYEWDLHRWRADIG